MEENLSPPEEKRPRSGAWLPRLLLAALLVAAILIFTWLFGDREILLTLADWEQEIRSFYREHPLATLLAAFLLYALVTGLSIPGALPLSLAYGWLLGFVPAVIVVSFASTSGATMAFLLSRYLIGQWVQSRFGRRLAWFNAAVEREGALFLFTLRLLPPVPFWLVNLLAGLTKIRVTTFWWVSQLGMLPGTLVFLWAGASAPPLAEVAEKGMGRLVDWRIFLALALLGLFPLAVRLALSRFRPSTAAAETPTDASAKAAAREH